MNTFDDELYQVFANEFLQLDRRDAKEDLFVHKVVGRYWLRLTESGHIPATLHEDLYKDLESEVTEMLRKKIYGFLSLSDYLEQKNSRPQ